MLIIYAALLVPALHSAIAAAERQPLLSSYAKPKQGIIDGGHGGQREHVHRQSKPQNSRGVQDGNAKSSYHKEKPGPRVYESGPKSPVPYAIAQPVDQSPPYFGDLFTMSAGYKVANEGPPVRQVTLNQNAGVHVTSSSPNLQFPVYKTAYPLSKATGPQLFSPSVQNQYNKKASSILQAHNNHPAYFNNYQAQPLILSPVDQFGYPERTPKLNNAQPGAPFLSPFSRFQGQVIPIPIANSNPQFPQFKGAAVQVHPTVGGFSAIGYEPLQMQPQLHFGSGNVQPVGGHRNLGPLQEIRTDVEVIDKKKPIPPPKMDDDDDEDDEGVDDSGKDYGPGNSGDDDYEPKPDKQFKPSQMEGNFKPSSYFPFKQYDEKFGKYSSRNHEEVAEEKPYTKYSDYSSSNDDVDDDDNEEVNSSGKYHSDGSSSKPLHGKQENEDDDGNYDYERQKAEDDSYGPKYYEKNYDDDFGGSYGRESPKQKYVKEESDDVYAPKSSYRNEDNHDPEDSTGQGSRSSFNYRKIPRGFRDNEGQGSDVLTRVVYNGGFGYKLPENVRSVRNRMIVAN
nr:uncharacterized protein LOC117227809 [Megalopta genalis]